MNWRTTTIAIRLAILIQAAVLMIVPLAIPAHARGSTASRHPDPYIVTFRTHGVRAMLRFASRSYPRDALIAVTDTVTNLSRRHLAIAPPFNPAGYPCSPPIVSLRSVNAQGQDAEPTPPIPFPAPMCALPVPNKFPVGTSLVEHQLVVLWTPRLSGTMSLGKFVGRNGSTINFSGFDLPVIRFHLRRRSPAEVTVAPDGSRARVVPPPGATGQYYWEGWGTCSTAAYGNAYWPLYWTPRRTRSIAALCLAPQKWYLAVAWLNHSVTSVVYP